MKHIIVDKVTDQNDEQLLLLKLSTIPSTHKMLSSLKEIETVSDDEGKLTTTAEIKYNMREAKLPFKRDNIIIMEQASVSEAEVVKPHEFNFPESLNTSTQNLNETHHFFKVEKKLK